MPHNENILYSTVTCPYALRARMSLIQQASPVILREIDLHNKPSDFLEISAKATVPVLRLAGDRLIDESRDIVEWVYSLMTISHQGPFYQDYSQLMHRLDSLWIPSLLRYKYPEQYADCNDAIHAQRIDLFFEQLNDSLKQDGFQLNARHWSQGECMLFPMAWIAYQWVYQMDTSLLPYPMARRWFENILNSSSFQRIMIEHPPWHEDQAVVYL